MTDDTQQAYFPFSIQLSSRAWDEFGLPREMVRNHAPSPLYPLRLIAQGVHTRRPGSPVSAGRLNLLALLNRSFRIVIGRYLEQRGCAFETQAARIGGQSVSLPGLPATLGHFTELFPPAAVLRGGSRRDFLEGEQAPENRRRSVAELFILAVQNDNPAAGEMTELFDDAELRRRAAYRDTLTALDSRLEEAAAEGRLAGSLLDLLKAPVQAAPHSLAGQLDYVRRNWAGFLPGDLLQGMLTAFDVLQEEQQMRGGGPGPIPVPRFGRFDLYYEEPERFSPDADWMSNVVMIAKTIYVWLDQLSKKYGRPIDRLDQIPDEELDLLARWGFSALWLIGIFERSPASEMIKRKMGNPEAVASAYSLYDYAVSQDLGGEEAVADLQERCRRRGIRLGCDVVPNHTGIYSRWTREHPDWYVQVDSPPYPAYRFTGDNLSFADDVEIYIEDGYWNHSDAAVVFKHVDRRDGRVRYIYHGNDGTHLPWNDTAQLNFLLPQVREAMIQTILRVARRYQIIRFDAAMTLAKKHYQRLWFPQPGGGAGVPSRAEHALSREEFDRAFPVEFWREVVDRVAAEVPDTLLLAEAFWLMEGYFVRTLGMHRVYNSAFMNMLKTEDNAKFRSVVKNILDFNPEILKRFVNFMNNPDEATAVAQFGKADKYFGVAVLLVTMPGLPMFGHGQIEGFEEKYGMEYRRAYRQETPDEAFIRHHEAQIFPLMRRRWLFSGSEQFVLYDFWADGGVNEDVFAYSNRFGDERALIAFHNRYAETAGWIRTSVPKKARNSSGEEAVVQPDLAAALAIRGEDRHYVRFRDFRTGLEYLRAGRELQEKGMYLQLGGYQYAALLDWRDIFDEDGTWGWVCHNLGGRPVESLDVEWKKVRYAPLMEVFRQAVLPGLLRALAEALARPAGWRREPACSTFESQSGLFFRAVQQTVSTDEKKERKDDLCAVLEDLYRLSALKGRSGAEKEALAALREGMPAGGEAALRRQQFVRVYLPWLLLSRLGSLPGASPEQAGEWMEEFLFSAVLQEIYQADEPSFRLPPAEAAGEALLVQILVGLPARKEEGLRPLLADLLEGERVQAFLGCHSFGGTRWFNRERLETLLYWLFFTAAAGRKEALPALLRDHADRQDCLALAEQTGFRFEPFVAAVRRMPVKANKPKEQP